MKLWDAKDAAIIAVVIRQVRPDSIAQTADLILQAAYEAGISKTDMEWAIERERKRDREEFPNG